MTYKNLILKEHKISIERECPSCKQFNNFSSDDLYIKCLNCWNYFIVKDFE